MVQRGCRELCVDRWQCESALLGNGLELAPSLGNPVVKRQQPSGKSDLTSRSSQLCSAARRGSSSRRRSIPFRASPIVMTLRCITVSGVSSVQAITLRLGRGFISSKMTLVSSRNPDTPSSPLHGSRRIVLAREIEELAARWRGAEELRERCGLLLALGHAIEVFGRNDHHGFSSAPEHSLRTDVAGLPEQLAEPRLGVVETPDRYRVGRHLTRLTRLVNIVNSQVLAGALSATRSMTRRCFAAFAIGGVANVEGVMGELADRRARLGCFHANSPGRCRSCYLTGVPRVNVFAATARALDAGRSVAIATVIGARGSTPRHLGARMAVASDGEQWGTVGGGRIEAIVVAAAREVAGGAPPRVVRQNLVRDLAMCCGGAMEVAITPAAPSRGALARLATPGSHVLVTPLDGGPLAVRAPRAGDPRLHHPVIDGDALVEVVGARERVIVFGVGHVGRALGPLLVNLGFDVVACDDGETGATDPPPAWGTLIESFDPAEVEAKLGGFTADDHILIVTRDHAIDQKLLEQLIARDDVGYLGMIGSRGKVGRFKKRLEARGLLDGELGAVRWARLRAPIGLDIGAETPEEIAVAIAGELVAQRRRGVAGASDWQHHAEHDAECSRR
jgi:xanthine dehydrogenase accessory factor